MPRYASHSESTVLRAQRSMARVRRTILGFSHAPYDVRNMLCIFRVIDTKRQKLPFDVSFIGGVRFKLAGDAVYTENTLLLKQSTGVERSFATSEPGARAHTH